MKRLAVLGILAIASCQQPVSGTATAPKPAGIVQFTEADLTNAIAIAQAAPNNPQAAMIVTCFTFLKGQLAALPSVAAPTGTVGAATAFVTADLALGNLANVTSPTGQAAFAINCGPLVTYQVNQGLSLANQIAALGAVLAPKL